jgi:hypothetical protein
MDGILTDGRTGKLWMCKKHEGHALGLHVRELQESGAWLDLLLEFREAVRVGECKDNATVALPDVMISGVVEGTKRDIECTICAARRTWFMGEVALERFLDGRRRKSPSAAIAAPPPIATQLGEEKQEV